MAYPRNPAVRNRRIQNRTATRHGFHLDQTESLAPVVAGKPTTTGARSEEHTSELQSHLNLVCRLLLEKKKIIDTESDTLTPLFRISEHTIPVLISPCTRCLPITPISSRITPIPRHLHIKYLLRLISVD